MEKTDQELVEKIEELRHKLKVIILAHNYQREEIQDIADILGDSLGLSQEAARADAEVIIFCGVHFMAESAAILSPEKTVILPSPDAGCPLADMITAEALRQKKAEHPEATVVCYVNSSAETKAESDICCTSANAVRVVNSVQEDTVLFIPDKNLGHFTAQHTTKKVILWEGYCPIHHWVTAEEVMKARQARPRAAVVVHPECQPEVIKLADHVCSTSGMISYAKKVDTDELIIGTEIGMLHRLRKEVPEKRFYIASPRLICPNMKKTSLLSVLTALENLSPVIKVDEPIRQRAKLALDRMLAIPRDR